MNSKLKTTYLTRRGFCTGLAAGASALWLSGCTIEPVEEEDERPPFVPRRMPPLMVDGWINDGPVTEKQLQGHVYVVDCFASWCGPCALAAPALVQLYLKYRYNGVRFIGLTGEAEHELDAVMTFVKRNNTDWPIAYGAGNTMQLLGVEAIPHVFVVGKDGMIVWDSQQQGGSMERAIRDALKQPNPYATEDTDPKSQDPNNS